MECFSFRRNAEVLQIGLMNRERKIKKAANMTINQVSHIMELDREEEGGGGGGGLGVWAGAKVKGTWKDQG